ncbi:hypothetical protein [Mycolicibacterium aromaticivorans]|uniref:hypothetical protein n=1 Tax=Mycolicibacterium aromaticivorans TaxID=318425 RepID=UPI0004B77A00|nr:hypothetical protein [Mycolicibacterium aromaticivorans]
MPAIDATGVPSLSQILSWDTEHLQKAAADWTRTAELWEDSFTQVRQASLFPGGTGVAS